MHPNSIANLRPPWKPGERPPSPGPSKVERALKIIQDGCPKAARLIVQTVGDPEAPLGLRLRCAEFMLDKTWPKVPAGAELRLGGDGVEWLELRFVAPGQPAAAAPETRRIPFDDRQGVGQSVGQVIDAETDDNDVNGL